MRKTRSDRGIPLSHGYSITHPKLYGLYFSMRARCRNPRNPAYERYGARGITLTSEWDTPEPFCDWALANGYASGLTLERIDNDKGYSPSNCCWATRKQQARNRRSSRTIAIGEARKTVAELAEVSGIKPGTLWRRLDAGEVKPERLFSQTAIRPAQRLITINGVGRTLLEWSALAGVHYTTICRRVAEGWSIEDAYTRKNDLGWRRGRKGY